MHVVTMDVSACSYVHMMSAEPHRSASIEERLFAESTGQYYVLPYAEYVTDVSDD